MDEYFASPHFGKCGFQGGDLSDRVVAIASSDLATSEDLPLREYVGKKHSVLRQTTGKARPNSLLERHFANSAEDRCGDTAASRHRD